MNKIVVSLILVGGLLLTTACSDSTQIKESSIIDLNSSSIINSDESSNTKNNNSKDTNDNINRTQSIIKFPIISIPKDEKEQKDIKYLEVNEQSTLQEKLDLISNAISQECFNGLPINISVFNENIAKVELVEPDNSSRVSWKEDYLNDQMKEYTLNVILKNILQEEYKGSWIEKVQLYYQGELISLN